MKNLIQTFVLKCVGIVGIALLCPLFANAQFLRTSYFMEGSHYRMQLNPALMSERGFVNLPVLGSFHANVGSNSLSYQDINDILDDDGNFYSNPKFLNRLKDNNKLNLNMHTDIISAGWYRGQNFWSINVSLRTDIGANVTKSMFTFLNEMDVIEENWRNSRYDISGQELNINAYTEFGVGYARAIDDRLNVGGRVKMLLGVGNTELRMESVRMNANLPSESRLNQLSDGSYLGGLTPAEMAALKGELSGYQASLEVRTSLKNSFKGLNLIQDSYDGYINDLDFDAGDLGIAGYGLGIDLGASYKILDNLTVSAALLDLGFISWSKGSTEMANTDVSDIDIRGDEYLAGIDVNDIDAIERNMYRLREDALQYIDRVTGGEVLSYDLLGLKKEEAAKSRTTGLATTLVLGGEYGLLDNKLGLGVLSTTRFLQPKTNSELTFSASYQATNWLDLALSYSVIQSAGKSFGLALRMGPVFIGTDYMFFGNNSNHMNMFAGISIPLAKK